MEDEHHIERLLKQDIKPTAMRLLVLRAIIKREEVFSLSDLESELETIDKSTIFRTLILFQQHNLVHTIDDGSGSLKYAICYEGCDCSIDQLHAHFYCTECKKVFCLRDTPIPVIALPDNFSTDTINYVVKGKCDQCRNIAT